MCARPRLETDRFRGQLDLAGIVAVELDADSILIGFEVQLKSRFEFNSL